MNDNEIKLPENLQNSEKAGFEIMRHCMIDLFGPTYIDKVVRKNREEFAKGGVLGWKPSDANTVIDISPMPDPWAGEWGYRLRFCALMPNGEALVNQFYVPRSTLPNFRKGDFSAVE